MDMVTSGDILNFLEISLVASIVFKGCGLNFLVCFLTTETTLATLASSQHSLSISTVSWSNNLALFHVKSQVFSLLVPSPF